MLSIIICSRNRSITGELADNIKNTVGVDYEIITIDNSENNYSICSAYNIGFTKSKYPYVCFVHEDVLFHTQKWGEKIISHLEINNTGIIGFAGSRLVTRVPIPWLLPNVNIIQSDKTGKKDTEKVKSPENYDQTKQTVIFLDGVMLSMNRELMMKIKFDESLSGFHGYDYDISIQSTISGYTNYVVYDIEIEHFSRGKTDALYYHNLITIFKKWERYLPLIGKSITKDEKDKIRYFEEKGLTRLTKLMIRKGFSTEKIIAETSYFATLINLKKKFSKLKYIRLHIFIARAFNKPVYLLKSKQLKF